MAKSSNQKLKILFLMKILSENTDEEHTLTLAEILQKLEACGITAERKSLYDDFEALRFYGLDIETRRDKTVGYYVANRTFELPELKLLVDAVQSSKFITRKKSMELIKKIEGFASVYEAQQLQRQVFVANRIKTMNESIYYTVDAIHAAISENVQISFQYYKWNEKKEKQLQHDGAYYHVSPWALTWDDENYYLVAFDSHAEKIKHYRVDKMLNLSLTKDLREGEDSFKGFDMAVYSKKVFGMYGGEDELIRLRCENRMADILIDRFGGDLTFFRVDEAHFEVTVKVSVSPLFLTWLMNFGESVKILSPGRVADELCAMAEAICSQYR